MAMTVLDSIPMLGGGLEMVVLKKYCRRERVVAG
jgi:hypothetical protein